MSSAEEQACLARLYVDSAFRRLFRADAESALGDYFLTVEERGALAEIDLVAVEDFAGAVKAKRQRGLEAAYGALFALGGAVLDVYLTRYFDLHPLRSAESIETDILRFGRFMEETLLGGDTLPPYASELVCFLRAAAERRAAVIEPDPSAAGAPAAQTRSTRRVSLDRRPVQREGAAVKRFEFNISDIERALSGGETPEPLRRSEQIVYSQRLGGEKPRLMRVSASTAELIELCDGTRTLGEVIAATGTASGSADFEAARQVVDRLLAAGVLEVRAQ